MRCFYLEQLRDGEETLRGLGGAEALPLVDEVEDLSQYRGALSGVHGGLIEQPGITKHHHLPDPTLVTFTIHTSPPGAPRSSQCWRTGFLHPCPPPPFYPFSTRA